MKVRNKLGPLNTSYVSDLFKILTFDTTLYNYLINYIESEIYIKVYKLASFWKT